MNTGCNQLPILDPQQSDVLRWENGLVLYKNFITEEEENVIITAVSEEGKLGGPGKRKSLHFGAHFDYQTFTASETLSTPIPAFINDLLPRFPHQEDLPDQFTVQFYPPGTGIPPHVDTHSAFGECIYSLSLGSCVPMSFQKCGPRAARRIQYPKRSTALTPSEASIQCPIECESEKILLENKEYDEWEIDLPPRSLLLMRGLSRYGYEHRIRGRKSDIREGRVVSRQGRYSITMRTIKSGKDAGCECDFPEVCDARPR